jgi:hypothetical protein
MRSEQVAQPLVVKKPVPDGLPALPVSAIPKESARAVPANSASTKSAIAAKAVFLS